MRNFIVAVELGSTKIIGVAGQKNSDGSFSLIAVAREDTNTCIKKGVIYNIDKTVMGIQNVINKLQNSLKTKISQVYVGVGGMSIHSVINTISFEPETPTTVTQTMINRLMDSNRITQYKDYEILEVETHEYKVDQQSHLDPAGIECSKIEGHFLNILQKKKFFKSIDNCFAKAGVKIAEIFLAPLATAEAVLTDSEKRNGCALFDIGAETTTVMIYHKNLLRHIAVLPIGSDNITKDIATFHIEETEAERLKLAHASAYTECEEIDPEKVYLTEDNRPIDSRKFINLVEARVQEIIQNALYQIPNNLKSNLIGGIIITGGMSNMKNIIKAIDDKNEMKVRIAPFVNFPIHTNNLEGIRQDGTCNTILGLLIKGELNCAGEEINDSPKLFDESDTKEEEIEKEENNEEFESTLTAAQIARLKKNEDKEEDEDENEVVPKKIEDKPKKPSKLKKFLDWIGDFTAPEV